MTREDGAAAPAERPSRALDERLAAVPARPGVYLLKDRAGQGHLRRQGGEPARARAHATCAAATSAARSASWWSKLADFETLVTANEKEALILENNLIKQYKPRYNIRLKDDKSYVSVKVTVQDAWPRVLVTRRIVKDGSRYFGPFASASAVRETLDTIRKVFPLRTCSDPVFRNRSRPVHRVPDQALPRPVRPAGRPRRRTSEHLRQAMLLLEGRSREVAARAAARRWRNGRRAERFEEAARLRDQLRAIEKTQERQQVVEHWGANQDVFGLYREGGCDRGAGAVRARRQARLEPSYSFDDWELPDDEVLEAVLTQFYQATDHDVPDEILLPVAISDAEVRAEYLGGAAWAEGRHPGAAAGRQAPAGRDGARQRPPELRRAAGRRRAGARAWSTSCSARLHLANAPKRIECVDIATFQGAETVGAMVAFDEGEPEKAGYRRFRIRSVVGTDDFAAVAEVLRRRFRRRPRARRRCPTSWSSTAASGSSRPRWRCSRELGITDVEVVGLAKERVERDADRERDACAGPSASSCRAGRTRSSCAELDGALPPAARARRGAPLREHLPPQAAGPRAAAPRRSTRSRASGRGAGGRCCAASAASGASARRAPRSSRRSRASRRRWRPQIKEQLARNVSSSPSTTVPPRGERRGACVRGLRW